MGFDLSVYLTRAEFEAFLEKLREEMEKFYAWLLAELKKLMTILKFMTNKYLNYNKM